MMPVCPLCPSACLTSALPSRARTSADYAGLSSSRYLRLCAPVVVLAWALNMGALLLAYRHLLSPNGPRNLVYAPQRRAPSMPRQVCWQPDPCWQPDRPPPPHVATAVRHAARDAACHAAHDAVSQESPQPQPQPPPRPCEPPREGAAQEESPDACPMVLRGSVSLRGSLLAPSSVSSPEDMITVDMADGAHDSMVTADASRTRRAPDPHAQRLCPRRLCTSVRMALPRAASSGAQHGASPESQSSCECSASV